MPKPLASHGRCSWAGTDPLYVRYHDEEWGVPHADSQKLFEKLVLEGFQSGLSWLTILKKRENFRRAFHGFDAEKIARYTAKDKARLMADAGIIRNRLKIEATIDNARAYLALSEHTTLAAFLWDFYDGKPLINRHRLFIRRAVADRTFPAHIESAQKGRLPLRRPDHGLCVPAVQRLRQRSPDVVPEARGVFEAAA